MKKKLLNGKNKIFIAVICLIALLLLTEISYSAYTSRASMRAVARNMDTDSICFSSNYLDLYATDNTAYVAKRIGFADTSDACQFDLEIYNYAKGNKNAICERDIVYDLKVTITGGNSIASVGGQTSNEEQTGNNVIYDIQNQTLVGRNEATKKYTISFAKADLNKLTITVVATPRDLSITGNQVLAAVIKPCTAGTIETFSARGRFLEENNKTPKDYDGFNYNVSISSGKAEATLTWNNNIFEIDKYFLEKHAKTQETGSCTFDMDVTDGTGDMLIRFYIKDKSQVPDTWDTMNNNGVNFSAREITTQGN